MTNNVLNQISLTLTEEEAKIIKLIREVSFGRVIVYKQDNKITHKEKTETLKG